MAVNMNNVATIRTARAARVQKIEDEVAANLLELIDNLGGRNATVQALGIIADDSASAEDKLAALKALATGLGIDVSGLNTSTNAVAIGNGQNGAIGNGYHPEIPVIGANGTMVHLLPVWENGQLLLNPNGTPARVIREDQMNNNGRQLFDYEINNGVIVGVHPVGPSGQNVPSLASLANAGNGNGQNGNNRPPANSVLPLYKSDGVTRIGTVPSLEEGLKRKLVPMLDPQDPNSIIGMRERKLLSRR